MDDNVVYKISCCVMLGLSCSCCNVKTSGGRAYVTAYIAKALSRGNSQVFCEKRYQFSRSQ